MRRMLLASLLATALSGCFFDDGENNENVVLLEDVIFISSNKLRILGRVYSSKGPVEDHGFYVSTTEDFQDPIIKSLGGKSEPGLFLAEFDLSGKAFGDGIG